MFSVLVSASPSATTIREAQRRLTIVVSDRIRHLSSLLPAETRQTYAGSEGRPLCVVPDVFDFLPRELSPAECPQHGRSRRIATAPPTIPGPSRHSRTPLRWEPPLAVLVSNLKPFDHLPFSRSGFEGKAASILVCLLKVIGLALTETENRQ